MYLAQQTSFLGNVINILISYGFLHIPLFFKNFESESCPRKLLYISVPERFIKILCFEAKNVSILS